MRTAAERIRAIQRHLGAEPDGLLGPQTLTLLERELGIDAVQPVPASSAGLLLSKKGIKAIVRFEIGSDNFYHTRLRHPQWPGGDSGVTIGVGYDLGYQSRGQFRLDWGAHISASDLERLALVCGKKRQAALSALPALADISISLNDARAVFAEKFLARYARMASRAYPGLDRLPADAQTAIVSLVLNRGAKMTGSTRREMQELKAHVRAQDLDAIADSILSMRRLWLGRNLGGLILRREAEALLARNANRQYSARETVIV